MTYIKDTLKELSRNVCVGTVTDAATYAESELKKYMPTVVHQDKNILGTFGDGEHSLLIAAHIDELGFIVTDVSEDGFLTVASCGSVDLRHIPSRRVIIHGRKKLHGVFCSVPPHLKKDETAFDDIGNFKIDSCLGKAAAELISAGDYVTFDELPCELAGNRITGKSLDNRAGVVCLLELARRLHAKELPIKVIFALTNEEELGCRGARIAAFYTMPDEAIAIDVTFGDAPDVRPEFCGKLGGGAMIGISPVLDRVMSDRFKDIAKTNNIPYDTEIMSSRTGTDGDVIAITGGGIKTGLISIPLRNMHTPCEVVDIADIKAVCDIIENYILSGGIKNV